MVLLSKHLYLILVTSVKETSHEQVQFAGIFVSLESLHQFLVGCWFERGLRACAERLRGCTGQAGDEGLPGQDPHRFHRSHPAQRPWNWAGAELAADGQ